ncbi:MAG: hypothetical protein ACRD2W_06545 [Acidimicrobiales bacterium]
MSRRVLRRSLALLVRSAPRAVAGLVVVQVVAGLAPAVAVAASATLLDNASAASDSDTARRATVVALVAVGLALALARIADALVSMLSSLVNHRFGAAVDGARMEAVGALPGLAHFDQPDLASAIQASQWAPRRGRASTTPATSSAGSARPSARQWWRRASAGGSPPSSS